MPLKKSVGNMYDFVTHTWSPVRGKCKHDCSYCYMKKWGDLPPMHIDEKDLMIDLGEDKFIFVGHTVDLFADDVPVEWIEKVLWRCREYPKNKYLFQSKNPARFTEFLDKFPPSVVFGTTIETNRTIYVESKAPSYIERAEAIGEMKELIEDCETIVTIEPIYDFDLEPLVDIIVTAKPTWINVGADSKGHKIPEPTKEQIVELIETLDSKMEVRKKNNLKRILGKEL
jgi:DNA repair photolyase